MLRITGDQSVTSLIVFQGSSKETWRLDGNFVIASMLTNLAEGFECEFTIDDQKVPLLPKAAS